VYPCYTIIRDINVSEVDFAAVFRLLVVILLKYLFIVVKIMAKSGHLDP
jgi:hypothetical protein